MSRPPVTTNDAGPLEYFSIALGWLVPGAGHLLIGQRARGLVFMVTIHGLFAMGLLIAGIKAMNPADQPIWKYTQLVAGWPTLIANRLAAVQVNAEQQQMDDYGRAAAENPALNPDTYFKANPEVRPTYFPKVQDVGTVYCGIAGMLNLLVLFDLLIRVLGGPTPENAERDAAGVGKRDGAVAVTGGNG